MLGATAENSMVRETWLTGFVHPCSVHYVNKAYGLREPHVFPYATASVVNEHISFIILHPEEGCKIILRKVGTTQYSQKGRNLNIHL
jgi:hypothetical protein